MKPFVARLRRLAPTLSHNIRSGGHETPAGSRPKPFARGWPTGFTISANISPQDAAFCRLPLRDVRAPWLHRIGDHDGAKEGEGGMILVRRGEACGRGSEKILENATCSRRAFAGMRMYFADPAVAGGDRFRRSRNYLRPTSWPNV